MMMSRDFYVSLPTLGSHFDLEASESAMQAEALAEFQKRKRVSFSFRCLYVCVVFPCGWKIDDF